jgi:poly(3-hydroxybutyrate) depolymerase
MAFARILFSILLLLAPYSSGAGKIVKQNLVSEGRKRTYYLLVPKNVSADQPAPLLVLLHGSMGNGRNMLERWFSLAEKEGVIVVAPDSVRGGGWSLIYDGPGVIHDVVEAAKAQSPVDPRRVYLFGYSAGAVYALQLSMLESEYFAATAIFAGAFHPEAYHRIDLAKRKIPMSIFVGTDDPFFPLNKVRATRDLLKERGFPVELNEIPGQDHDYSAVYRDVNRDAWKFLREHSLSEDPRYRGYNYRDQ